MAMTLNEAREALREYRILTAEECRAIDAHLTQPAQAVAIYPVGHFIETSAGQFERVSREHEGDDDVFPLYRALAGEQSVKVWRCTRSRPTGAGGTHHSLEYAKCEADMLILRDKGYACEPLPASNPPDRAGESHE